MFGRFSLSSISLVVALLLFLAVNILGDATLRSTRLDLTEARLFTLSDGSRRIARALEEPITLRLFYSEQVGRSIPMIHNYARRVRELLEEYVAASEGRIVLEVLNPEPFSVEEEVAVENGVDGRSLGPGVGSLYFGLSGTNSTDGRKAIPFLDPRRAEFLEYDITKLIHSLDVLERPRIGLMTTLPMQGDGGGPMAVRRGGAPAWAVHEQARELFELVVVDPTEPEIDPAIDVLAVVHPRGLSAGTWFAIDQFVLRGGRLMLFVDPHCESQPSGPANARNPLEGLMEPKGSDAPELLRAWGLELVPDVLAADRKAALKVPDAHSRRGELVDHLAYLGLGEQHVDRADIVTGSLRLLNVGTAGVLRRVTPRVAGNAGLTITPLIETSEDSGEIAVEDIRLFPDLRRMLAEFQPSGERKMIAARVEGRVHSAFPDGMPADAAGFAGKVREVSDGTATILVVADADLLSDPFWVRPQEMLGMRVYVPFADNGNFFINALDHLSGSTDLISVRGRQKVRREFTRIADLRREAEDRFLEKEQELRRALEETEQKLRELRTEDAGAAGMLILTPEQRREIEKFQEEKLRIARQLREVQHDLRKDIERLEGRIKAVNIGLVPMLVAMVAIVLGVGRLTRRRS